MLKGIILAAGQGLRLRPLTDDAPKCLVPYKGKPIIDHTLQTLRTCGFTDISVVGGYRSDVLQKHLAGSGVKLYVNDAYECTNMVASLFCAEPELSEDTIISYGDIVYGASVLGPLLACEEDFAITSDVNWMSLWERRMDNPLADAETFRLTSDGYVKELGKRPHSMSEVEGQFMGLIRIGRRVWPRVRSTYHSLRNADASADQMFMTDFLQALIEAGLSLKAVSVRGGWIEIDRLEDLALEIQ